MKRGRFQEGPPAIFGQLGAAVPGEQLSWPAPYSPGTPCDWLGIGWEMRHETVISCNPFTIQVQYNTIRTLILYGVVRSMFRWGVLVVEERGVWHLWYTILIHSDVKNLWRLQINRWNRWILDGFIRTWPLSDLWIVHAKTPVGRGWLPVSMSTRQVKQDAALI